MICALIGGFPGGFDLLANYNRGGGISRSFDGPERQGSLVLFF